MGQTTSQPQDRQLRDAHGGGQAELRGTQLANEHVYLQSPFLIPDVSVAEALTMMV